MSNQYVCIVEDDGHKPHRVMGPMGERRAERVASGAGINLNHEAFHIDVLEEDELPEGWLELAK